jgi:NAD(P)-dependent dehydrogenase (short-subunit alcohol dehydrogenase family)
MWASQINSGPLDVLAGKTCVITGATSGIGLSAAMQLAAMGARLVLVGHHRSRGEAAVTLLRSRWPAAKIEFYCADLSLLTEVRRLGNTLRSLPRIDVLINNAGAIFSRREETEDGLERTFALNHMAYFLLTELLRQQMIRSAPSRIVNVASAMHRLAKLDWSDLQTQRLYFGWRAYCRTKLYNVLFTRELARQLHGTEVTVNCLHPGFVASRFGDNNRGLLGWSFWLAKVLLAPSPDHGAATVVHLASSPEVLRTSGGYFMNCVPALASQAACNDDAAARLWRETARLAGL